MLEFGTRWDERRRDVLGSGRSLNNNGRGETTRGRERGREVRMGGRGIICAGVYI